MQPFANTSAHPVVPWEDIPLAQLAAAMQQEMAPLAAFSAAHGDKPLVCTEGGSPSRPWAYMTWGGAVEIDGGYSSRRFEPLRPFVYTQVVYTQVSLLSYLPCRCGLLCLGSMHVREFAAPLVCGGLTGEVFSCNRMWVAVEAEVRICAWFLAREGGRTLSRHLVAPLRRHTTRNPSLMGSFSGSGRQTPLQAACRTRPLALRGSLR